MKTKKKKEELKKREINKIIKSSNDKFLFFYVNIEENKEPKMSTKAEIARLIKWLQSLEPIDIKQVNEEAAIKEKITEKNIVTKEELDGDYIVNYKLVKYREKIVYYDNSIKYGDWGKPMKEDEKKRINQDLINKREKEKKEKERQEKLKKEKEDEKKESKKKK